jgi:hypothetical protein
MNKKLKSLKKNRDREYTLIQKLTLVWYFDKKWKKV